MLMTLKILNESYGKEDDQEFKILKIKDRKDLLANKSILLKKPSMDLGNRDLPDIFTLDGFYPDYEKFVPKKE